LNVEKFIATRYLFSKGDRTWQAVNYITLIASAGVLLTVAALFVILSAFSGLRVFNMSLMDKTDPDLRILPEKNKFFVYSDSLRRTILSNGQIVTAAPVVEEKALLQNEGKQTIVLVRGTDSLYKKIIRPADILLGGEWPGDDYPGIAAGQMLAAKLSLNVNDPLHPVYITIPARKTSGLMQEQLISKPFVVSGIYQLTPDVEKKYVYVPIRDWRQMLRLKDNEVSFIDIKLKDKNAVPSVKAYLRKHLPAGLTVKDKMELNRSVMKMLNMENLFTYITGLLFLIIAVFNIVGSIIILILKKKKDRFVLSSLGMDLARVRKIFFYYGNMLILFSGLAGLVLGIIIVWIQKQTGWVKVPGTYLTYPVQIKWTNMALVVLTVVLISLTASWLASRAVKEIKEKI